MDAEPHVVRDLTVAERGVDARGEALVLDLAHLVMAARDWPELRRTAEPAIRAILRATRVTLGLSEAYLAPHLDLTTVPPLGPLLRVPLEHEGRTLGVLEVTADDADRLTAARRTAERLAALLAARLADLRTRPPVNADQHRPPALADALDGLGAPVAVTATSDGAQVWRNRAYRTQPPPPVGEGPDVVVAVGDLAVAAWGATADDVRIALDDVLATPHPTVVLRPVHDARGAVTEFDVAWSNRRQPELGGAPLEMSVRAATRRVGHGQVDLFAQLTRILRTQTTAHLSGLDIAPSGAARPFVAGLDITLAPLGDAVVLTWHATTDPARALRSIEDREQLFRSALDATLDPVTIVVPVHDEDGDAVDFELVWCNRAYLAIAVTRPGDSMRAYAHMMPSVDIVAAHRRVHETGEPMVLDDVRVEALDPTGATAEAFVDVGIARFGAGLLTSFRPATQRVRAELDLQESERLFRSAFDEAPRGMLLYSLDESCLGRCLRANPAFVELAGYTEQEILDGGWPLVVPPDEAERTRSLFAEMAAGRLLRRRMEGHIRTSSGTIVDVQADCSVVTHGGRPGYCVVHVEDITERRRAESEISWLAMHDAVTGLPNRHLFLHQVRHALGRLERRPGTVAVLSVVVRDDVLGDTADVMLTEVARRIGDVVRRSDTPARLGGTDFAVLLPEIGGPEAARRLARRVMDALAPDVLLADGDMPLRASVGLSLTGDPDADAGQLVRDARLDAGQARVAQAAHSEVVETGQRHA